MSWTKVPTGCFELTKATIILWRSWLPIHLKILLWYVLWLLRCIVISILFPPLTSTPIFQLLEGQNIQVIHQYEQLWNESIQREIYIYKRRENFYLKRQQLRPSALVLLKTASFPNSNASTHQSVETPDTILTGLISDGVTWWGWVHLQVGLIPIKWPGTVRTTRRMHNGDECVPSFHVYYSEFQWMK